MTKTTLLTIRSFSCSVKVCLIGLGHWGKNHARILGNLKRTNVIDELYLFDVNKEQAQKYADLYDAKVTDNPYSLDLDAVDIVVPAHLHHKVAKPFVESGIKTFIEKPFVDNIEDAIDLMDLCKNPESSIMVGHIFRFHSGVELANNLIQNGSIGNIQKIDIRRLAFGIPRTDNGVIYSLAIHDLDLFRLFSNEQNPESIQCITSKIVGPTEDHAFIKANYENHVGIAEESWMSPSTQKVRTCSIQGTHGEIFFDFSKPNEVNINSVYIDDKLIDNGSFNHSTTFVEPLTAEIEHFISQSQRNKPYKVGPTIGLEAIKLCDMALKSAKEKKIIYESNQE